MVDFAIAPERDADEVLVYNGLCQIARDYEVVDVVALGNPALDPIQESTSGLLHFGAIAYGAVGRDSVKVIGPERHERTDVFRRKRALILVVPFLQLAPNTR